MTYFACFGFHFSWMDVMLILGTVLGIACLFVGGIAFVISRVFSMPLWKVLAGEMGPFAVAAMVFWPMGYEFEGYAFLSLLGAASCLLLMAAGWLINRLRIAFGLKNRQKLCSLNLNDDPVVEYAE